MTTTPILNHAQIEALWVQFGGGAGTADMAAAIAQAESGGNPGATNTNDGGSVDRGLFQINSVHGPASTYDIDKNIKAAILISAAGHNWRPWCTAWSDNACGSKGGTYLGAGAAFHAHLTGGYNPADVKAVKASDGTWSIVDGAGKNVLNAQISPDESGQAIPEGITGGLATGLVNGTIGWAKGLAALLGNLLNPRWWLRVGQGLASVALLWIGAGLVFRQDATAFVGTIAKARTGGAASMAAEAAA